MTAYLFLFSCVSNVFSPESVAIESVGEGEAVRWHGHLTPVYEDVDFAEVINGLPFYYAFRDGKYFRAYFTVNAKGGPLFITRDDSDLPWIGYLGEDYPAFVWGGVVQLADGQAKYLIRDSLGAVASSQAGPYIEHELEPTHVIFVHGSPVLLRLGGDHAKFNLWGYEAL